MKSITRKTSMNTMNILMFLCALLASLVPRYISAFKIHLGINISFYTIFVVIVYVVFSHRFVVYKKIESYFILIWFLFVLLSIWRAEQFGVWGYYIVWTLTAILYAQILYICDSIEVYESIINGLLVGMFIHLIIGFIEINTHSYFFAVGITGRSYYGMVPVSIFHNPNDYVTFLITTFPFLVYQMMRQKLLIKKIVYFLIVIFAVYMIYRSNSRSSFFAMLLLGLTLLWVAYRKSNRNRLYIIFGVAALFLVVFGVPQIRNRIISVFVANQIEIMTTDRARINLLKNAFYFLKQTYGAGVGAGNLHVWLEERAIYPIGNLRLLHNWYAELLATFGVVFFVFYMVFHIKIIINLAKRYDSCKAFWNLDNAMLFSFIGFSIVSIASSSNIYSEWIWMYLIFMATYSIFTVREGIKRDITRERKRVHR